MSKKIKYYQLVENSDYRIKYPDDLTSFGVKTVTLSGMGDNYVGNRTCQYIIYPSMTNVEHLGVLESCGKITKLEFNKLSDFYGIINCPKLTSIIFKNPIIMIDEERRGVISCSALAEINFSQMSSYSTDKFNINKLEEAIEGEDIKKGFKIKVPKLYYPQIITQYNDSPLKTHIISS